VTHPSATTSLLAARSLMADTLLCPVGPASGEGKIAQRKRCVFHGVMPRGAASDYSYVVRQGNEFVPSPRDGAPRKSRRAIAPVSSGGSAASLPFWTSPVNPKVLPFEVAVKRAL
jgi:hypothetical protein